jgi:hypothetical protein
MSLRAALFVFLAACTAAPPPARPAPRIEPRPAPPPSVVPVEEPQPQPSPEPPAPAEPTHDAERARAEEALAHAGLKGFRVEGSPDASEDDLGPYVGFQLYDGSSIEGWIHVHDEQVTIQSLETDLPIEAWKAQRAKAIDVSGKLGKIPLIRDYCKWAPTAGAIGCVYWVEGAPKPGCKKGARDCMWQIYVGSNNGAAAARHFTFFLDDAGNQFVLGDDFETLVPPATWRKTQPF